MSQQDDRLKALKFERPTAIPVSAGILPAAWIKYREALDAIVARHPVIFGTPRADRNYDEVGGTYVQGEHVDAWGCVWSNPRHGMEAIVTGHPVRARADVRRLRAPTQDTGLRHGFMFLRLTDLRGFEEMMVDFAEEPPELAQLLEIVCAYNVRQAEIAVADMTKRGPTLDRIVYVGDDLGMQTSLPLSPAAWRRHLKPCYARIYAPFRDAGCLVYMHSDGHIFEIIPDLVDCGVRVINPQVRANGLDNLARVCKGKVCVDLDLDRQLFPFCTPKDIDRHVREAVVALGAPEGGLWLKAEIGPDVPLANIEAICTALETYRTYWS